MMTLKFGALALRVDDMLLTSAVSVIISIAIAATLAAFHARVTAVPQVAFIAAQLLTLGAVVWLIAVWLQRKVWRRPPLLALLGALPLLVVFGLAVSMILSGFSRHDEIYSWNLWAIQHFLREPYDRTYTAAAYPQLYAYWMASIYGAQSSIDSQVLTRFFSVIPALVLMVVTGAFWPSAAPGAVKAPLVTLLMLVSTLKTLQLSYADPLMSAALITSVAMLLCYAARPDTLRYLVASVACGVVAAFTKQPAILWVCGILPLAVVASVWRWHWPIRSLWATILGAALVGAWLWMSFAALVDNQGVMHAGLGDRGIVSTALTAAYSYLISKPHFLFIVLAGAYAARRDARLLVQCCILFGT